MTRHVGKVVAVVQARMGSTRLPGKMMADLAGKPLIEHVMRRTSAARLVDEVWLATSNMPENEVLAAKVESLGFPVLSGSEDDVLSRYAEVARRSEATWIVRICGDCPFVDPSLVDLTVERLLEGDVDYACNTLKRTYPDGLDVEAFSRDALDRADREARDPILRVHVTPYIHGRLRDRFPAGDFRLAVLEAPSDLSHLRWTVDEAEDLELARRLLGQLPGDFGWMDVVALQTRFPDLLHINVGHAAYEGTERDIEQRGDAVAERGRYAKSNAFIQRALETIPLASQTFSKSHQQWVRGAAPLFIESGRGCQVTDLDGNRYIDYVLALMPIVLGYGDPDVDAAIRAQLGRGIVFSLASRFEAELAERLVRLIPCAEQARFGKSGSDATSAAVRLARAHTGRERVLVCGGYHGWHDWYIGTTTRDLGVPAAVKSLTVSVPFNDVDAVADTLKANPDVFACLIMEPTGATRPLPGYLEAVRDLTQRDGTLLVFDEIITGFRIHLGGAQAHLGVVPDLACFGKSMGNGMPVSAVVGPRNIMKGMEDIFFSGTFGGEALSLAAAIATIDKLENEGAVSRLWRLGERLMAECNSVLEQNGLGSVLRFGGDGWWPRLQTTLPAEDKVMITSLFRQECNANGLLLAASLNLSLAHDSPMIVEKTVGALDRAVGSVREAMNSPDPGAHLKGQAVRPTFQVRG